MPETLVAPVTPREPHRSFTVRVPQSLYNRIGDLAIADGVYTNVKINELLRLGLERTVNIEEALTRLIKRQVAS